MKHHAAFSCEVVLINPGARKERYTCSFGINKVLYLSIYLSIYLSVYLSIYLSVHVLCLATILCCGHSNNTALNLKLDFQKSHMGWLTSCGQNTGTFLMVNAEFIPGKSSNSNRLVRPT